ncbi:MAG: hypothetical protein ACKVRN_06200 [Pyrinomonadaceae bacterium]
MTQSAVIENTISTLSKLPIDKAEEVADFADFVLRRYENSLLQEGITQIVGESEAFAFLADEEDLYTKDDLRFAIKRCKI